MSSRRRALDGLDAVGRLGDDLAGRAPPRAPSGCPRRTTVWSSASRMRIFSGVVISPAASGRPRCRAARAALTSSVAADEQRALAHAAHRRVARRAASASMPRPSSRTRRTTAPFSAPQAQLGAAGARVAHDVDEALLGDAVDDELVLRAERGQVAVELRGDAQAAVLGEVGAERDERRAQPEVVERLRAQAAHELAHLLDARARRRLERAQLRRAAPPAPAARASRAGARRRSASARSRRAARAPSARRSSSWASSARRPLSRRSRSSRSSMSLNAWLSSATSAAWRSTTIRRPGASGSTRRISAVSCSSGRNTRRSASRLTASTSSDADPEHGHLAALDPRADGRGRQREHRDGGDQHSGVDREDAPEQGHGLMMASRR